MTGPGLASRLEAMLFRKAQFSPSWVTGARPYASRTGFSDRLPAARDCGAHPPDDKRHHPFAAGRVPSTPTRSPDHTGWRTHDNRQRRALDRPQGQKRALPSVRAGRVGGCLKITPRAVPGACGPPKPSSPTGCQVCWQKETKSLDSAKS